MSLDRGDLVLLADLVADRVLERLGGRIETGGLLDANEVARRLGTKPGWVYANAERLGAIRLGDGPRARLRFRWATVERATTPGGSSGGSDDAQPLEQPTPRRRRRVDQARRAEMGSVPLLPIKGRAPGEAA